ncbi:MAG: DUF5686 and carboxypeptidase regulatory-like domain-containing protein [Chitinophagales bacterium]|nr:DUF5686 and carboxypeptidase regulatory-like domain-containing protein [Chitinophagales bacterium]MDW8427027.1 DUF5686 and carboxypeptidase regulatory-like domain-containing protein [Chitinophagales bacterium]
MIRTLLFFLTLYSVARGAGVYGTVRDEKAAPLPYVTIYVKGTGIGTTTNEEGQYHLKLSPGNYEIVFQHIGYQRQVVQVQVPASGTEVNVVLMKEAIELQELTVTEGGEDPAYAIIRKAQERRRYHRDQVKAYACHVYIKGVQRLTEIPPRIMGFSTARQGLDSSRLGTIYQSESESQFFYQAPNRTKEIVYSSKVSGNNQAFTWNTATAFTSTFYDNLIFLGGVSPRGLVSPIAEGALLFYRYTLLGTFYEDGRLINKIEVTPRRSGDPVFRGLLYIVEDRWNIHSLDLTATREAKLEFVDTLRFVETYKPVNDTAWMPATQLVQFSFSILGVKGHGYFLGIFSKYDLSPRFTDRFFNGELIRITNDANRKDSAYWEQYRPVPLTDAERQEYRRQDSLHRLRTSKRYLDSVDRQRNRFQPEDLLLGYTYRNSYRRWSLDWTTPLLGLSFNAVEGWNLTLEGSYEKDREDRTGWELTAAGRYGFAARRVGARLQAELRDDPFHQQRWRAGLGWYPLQVNEEKPIAEWVNALYSLFKHQHLIRLYEKQYVELAHRREWGRGIVLEPSLSAARRRPLFNSTEFSWASSEPRRYDANTDFGLAADTLIESTLFSVALSGELTPGQTYIVRPQRRIALEGKWPTLRITYRHALVWQKGLAHFGKLEFSTNGIWSMGLAGKGLVYFNAGTFLIDQPASILDFKHFAANQTLIGINWSRGYQLLPYYSYSSDGWWVQVHYEQHWGGFFMNKIPIIRKVRLQEVTGLHLLASPELRYVEAAFGLENILKIFRIDYVWGFDHTGQQRHGARIGLLLTAALGSE